MNYFNSIKSALWYNLGLVSEKFQTTKPLAIYAYNAMLNLDEDHLDIYQKVADLYFEKGELNNAWHMYLSLYKANPDDVRSASRMHVCSQLIGVKVLAYSVDLKLTADNQVKVLEMGTLPMSEITEEGDCIDDLIRRELMARGIPYRQVNVNTQVTDDIPGYHKVVNTISQVDKKFDIASLHDYEAVIRAFHHLYHPDKRFLPLGDASVDFLTADKVVMHQLFSDVGLAEYRPLAFIFDRTDMDSYAMALHYFQQWDHVTHYVLKLPSLTNGDGVYVMEKQKLSVLLEYLLLRSEALKRGGGCMIQFSDENMVCLKKEPRLFQEIDEMAKEIFSKPDSCELLVEECVKGKDVALNQQDSRCFDTTIRHVCLLIRHQGAWEFIPLMNYHKFPSSPRDAKGDLRARVVSSWNTKIRFTSANETKIINDALQSCMPKLVGAAVQRNFLAEVPLNQHDDIRRFNLAWLMSQCAHAVGQWAVHEESIKLIRRYLPDNMKEMVGVVEVQALMLQGKFEESLQVLQKIRDTISPQKMRETNLSSFMPKLDREVERWIDVRDSAEDEAQDELYPYIDAKVSNREAEKASSLRSSTGLFFQEYQRAGHVEAVAVARNYQQKQVAEKLLRREGVTLFASPNAHKVVSVNLSVFQPAA